jgi:phage FluMu protein Com
MGLEIKCCRCAEIAELQDVIKAAWRLRFHSYHDWAMAGGVNNCPHGIGEGIQCARCDEMLLRKTYEQMTSPNEKALPQGGAKVTHE